MIEYVGLHISRDSVKGVLTRHSGKDWVVAEAHTSPWSDGENLVRVLKEFADKFGPIPIWSVGIPHTEVSVRPVSFPFGGSGAIKAALPFEMETFLPYPAGEMETTHIKISSTREETKTLACAARKERLAFYRKALKDAGIEAQIITPESAAMLHLYRLLYQDAPEEGRGSMLLGDLSGGDLLLCFTEPDGFCDIHSALAERAEIGRFIAAVGREPSAIFIGGENSQALTDGKYEQSAEFMDKLRVTFGENAKPQNIMTALGLAAMAALRSEEPSFAADLEKARALPGALKWTIIGAALSLVLALSYPIYNYYSKQKYYEQLKLQSIKVFQTALPATKPVKPSFQLTQKMDVLQKKLRLAGLTGSGRVDLLWVLKRMSETLPEGLPMEMDEILYEGDFITIAGKTDKFESVTRLKELYSIVTPFKSCEVVDSKTAVDGKKISFKISMAL